ncbi:MAG: hypothetical protein LUF82_07535 [Clostridia bacterium]|nr:hypothetical protein [Clostridia bacterium]
MKKILATLSIAAIMALGIGGLAACSGNNSQKGFASLDTDTEVYGFSAASAAMIISSMNGSQTAEAQTANLAKNQLTAGTTVTDEETINTLNSYMTLVENLLGSGGYTFTEGTSDNSNYAVKLTISCGNLSGENFEYVMYYNETLVSEITEKDGTETETEQIYSVEGLIYIDGISYSLNGRKQTSTESDLFSTETETEHQLTITLSETSYMKVEQEVSEEDGESEQEYKYSIYENNVLTESCSFEYEQEKGETEIEMKQSTRNANGVLETQTFYFEKETEYGKEVIKIKVGSNTSAATYTVSIETDESGNCYYVYTLNNGNTYNKNRG